MTKAQKLAQALMEKPKRAKRSPSQRVFLAVFKNWNDDFWDETHDSTGLMTKAASAESLLHNLPAAKETDTLTWGIILNGNGFKNTEEAIDSLRNYYEGTCGGKVTVGEDASWTLWGVKI